MKYARLYFLGLSDIPEVFAEIPASAAGGFMNYATIKYFDVANGPGVRVSLYVSGCRNHCKNCFNPETWDFNYGEPFTAEVENSILEGLKPEYIKGFTLLPIRIFLIIRSSSLEHANTLSITALTKESN